MLTFYPEFEVDNITDNEIILLLDLSNSMKVCALVIIMFVYGWTFCLEPSQIRNLQGHAAVASMMHSTLT